jgi:hypothetical protein
MRIDCALGPLVEKLRARYPGVHIVEAHMSTLDDGAIQQCIRYCAPLEMLKHYGLLTEEMLRKKRGPTSLGEGFHLCEGLDYLSLPGCWDLSAWTATRPRERPRIGTTEAQRILKRIFKEAKAKH